MRSFALLLLAGCQVTDPVFVCPDGAPFCATMAVLGDHRPAARGVDITSVYFYQGNEIPLVEDGVSIAPDLPVVAGRDAVFRIAVTTLEGFTERALTARVSLFDGDELVGAFQGDFNPAVFDPTQLTTSANVRVSGGAMLSGELGWKVEIVEASTTAAGSGPGGVDTWPEKGVETFTAVNNGDEMRVRLIPIHFAGDETGLPDLSDEQINTLERRIWSLYPVADVVMSIDDPWDTEQDMNSFDGWVVLLGEVTGLRTVRNIPGDEWIYGLLAPTGYGGGVAGLSNLGSPPPDAQDMFPRSSIGLGGTGVGTADIMGHEMGHASGRPHSPGCGAGGPDPAYPYEDGSIGRRGYDMVGDLLLENPATLDHMTYCYPQWVSDYNYQWYFDKVQAVNALYRGEGDGAVAARVSREPWRAVWLYPSGRGKWGELRLGRQTGEPRRVDLLDKGGVVIGQADATFQGFDHLGGGVVSLPEPGPEVAAVRVDGHTIAR